MGGGRERKRETERESDGERRQKRKQEKDREKKTCILKGGKASGKKKRGTASGVRGQ